MTTNTAIWWHRDLIVVTLDDANGQFVVTEHVAVIVNQRVRQHRPGRAPPELSQNSCWRLMNWSIPGTVKAIFPCSGA